MEVRPAGFQSPVWYGDGGCQVTGRHHGRESALADTDKWAQQGMEERMVVPGMRVLSQKWEYNLRQTGETLTAQRSLEEVTAGTLVSLVGKL